MSKMVHLRLICRNIVKTAERVAPFAPTSCPIGESPSSKRHKIWIILEQFALLSLLLSP